jgi:hypothetical protein
MSTQDSIRFPIRFETSNIKAGGFQLERRHDFCTAEVIEKVAGCIEIGPLFNKFIQDLPGGRLQKI